LRESTVLADSSAISSKAENTVPRYKIGLASPHGYPAMNGCIPNKL
jgi:hypothetical protein